ncbi:probable transcriptional regulatory protein aq_1575 [Topomyia yanbarensis]|uniref:probable transcriptional regulatory protein aq_1575 n=1 Tax=Topomyia yanbarensis TaxID=2498891 RepID=UPI00273C4358|nr:probable transcriptional regulatory protein aq_1575 [Topomyia yanbarensis]
MFQSIRLPVQFLCKQLRISAECVRNFGATSPLTAGHSKWQNIRHIKALNDGRKSVLFIKLARQIRLAIQAGGPNPALNSTLRATIDEALKKNMPNSTIQGILKKSAQNPTQLKRFTLEMKAFNQINIMCVLYTEKFTQTKMELASVLRRNLAMYDDVKHLFDEQGFVEAIAPSEASKEDLLSCCTEHAIEVGAEDVEVMSEESKLIRFICAPIDIEKVKTQLEKLSYTIEHSEHAYVPKSTIKLNPDATLAYENLKEKLRAIDGVEDIYDNVELVYSE